VKLLLIPKPWLYGGILVFATLGTYTLNSNATDLVLLWIIGLAEFGMWILSVPVAPCIVGLILGPLAEQQFRRALAISQGDLSVFYDLNSHPIAVGLLTLSATLVLAPVVLRFRRAERPSNA
jgi:putative tricarboxylic transport membrane protein